MVDDKGRFTKGQTAWNKGVQSGNHGNGFQKGKEPWNKGKKLHYEVWNKGTKGLVKAWNKGKEFPEKSGENHFNWKGDNVGRRTLHKWVEKYKGKPGKCELCQDENAKKYEWANKSGEYKRELSDWLRLCGKCHFAYDKQHERKRDYHGKLL